MMHATYGAPDGKSSPSGARARAPDGEPPRLWVFTDPARTPDPLALACALPAGAGLVFRHFGLERLIALTASIAAAAEARGVRLLIAADPDLAQSVGADGVHWPQSRLPTRRALKSAPGLITAAAHDARAARRAAARGADLVFISPVAATRSAGSGRPLGFWRAGSIACATPSRTVALGGLTPQLIGRARALGFWGVAGVDGFTDRDALSRAMDRITSG